MAQSDSRAGERREAWDAEFVEDLVDFFENGAVALHWVAADGTILRANRAELEMMGYPREEYVGRNIAAFHADQGVYRDVMDRLAAGEVLRNYPVRLILGDGSMRDFVLDSSVYRKNGTFRHTRCFTRDASERRAAAARIRGLNQDLTNALLDLEGVLSVVPIGIGIARDPECTDIRVNPAFADQLGIRPDVNASKTGEEAARLPFRVMKDGVEVPGDQLPMQRAARENVTLRDLEYDIVHDDGRVVRLLEYAAPLVDASGKIRGAVGAFADITLRRRLELERERLLESERAARAEAEAARAEAERAREAAEAARAAAEEAREVAEAANVAKSTFLAVMSHELRTPLNAICGYVDLLEGGIRGPLTPPQQHDLARIRKNQNHLLGLINQVLDYARLETRKVRFDVEDVPLAEVAATVQPLVEPQFMAKDVTLHVQADGHDVAVRADREKLQRILLNLLSNAAKFNRPGGTVSVDWEVTGQEVLIRVTDTGLGIPADRLETIFEPFVQVDTRLNRMEDGVGLGLAISRDLAQAMDGDLTVESTEGEGSTFTLRLPAVVTG